MATKKKELNPEAEQQIEDVLKKQLEAAYLRGLKAGCKTIAAACLEAIKKNKTGVAMYKIAELCKKTMGLPVDKVEEKKKEVM